MAGRSEIRDPVQSIVDEARRQIDPPLAPDRTSAANAPSPVNFAPNIDVVTDAEDGEGNPYAQWPFLLDVDSMDDAHAIMP